MTSPRAWHSFGSRRCVLPAAAAWLVLALTHGPASADPAVLLDLPPPAVRAWQTGLLRGDRIQHASLAWTLGLGVGLATREPVAAYAAPFTLGLAKEIADRSHSGFDRTDLLADLIGSAAAAWITARWRP